MCSPGPESSSGAVAGGRVLGPAALLRLDGGAVGGEQFVAGRGQVVEESGLRSMTGSTAALACCTTWFTICWAAPPATAPSSGDCSRTTLSATVSKSLRSSSPAEPGGGPYCGAAAGLLRGEVLGARRRPGVGVGRAHLVAVRLLEGVLRGVGRGALIAHGGLQALALFSRRYPNGGTPFTVSAGHSSGSGAKRTRSTPSRRAAPATVQRRSADGQRDDPAERARR